ncbi:MAG: L,D-transpeptidase family protein [Patescibacteria group bacterium]|jgi:lipoprotein-anchoring transpeptidase ErfK/SrfK
MKSTVLALAGISLLFSPLSAFAAHGKAPKVTPPPAATELKIFSPSGDLVTSFLPFDKAGNLAGSVAVGDLGTDKISEIIVGAGAGNKPLIRTFRLDGTLIKEFSAYGNGMKSGVNAALCDLNGDGLNDIVTGASVGGGPQVRVFSSEGKFMDLQFFAYDEKFRGGVNIACADVDADGKADILTGAGPGGEKTIKVFSSTGTLKNTITVSSGPEKSGTYVFTANLDQDAESEIVTAPMANGTFDLTLVDLTPAGYIQNVKSLSQTSPSYGLSITADKRTLIYVNGAYSAKTQVSNLLNGATFVPFADATEIAPRLGVIPETGNIVALGAKNVVPLDPATQSIKVDISEQRLYAYTNNVLTKTFLVSTGKRGYNTPIGKTTIMKKIPIMSYVWNYGPGNPNNYNLPNVKWNMRIFPHIYIHSAYWHNNFGHPMSHGCINTSIPDADWIFHWVSEGTSVETVL